MDVLPIIPCTEQVAYEHARIWAELEESGMMIGYYDLIVGATATQRGSTVAAFNKRHFARIRGLLLLNRRSRHEKPYAWVKTRVLAVLGPHHSLHVLLNIRKRLVTSVRIHSSSGFLVIRLREEVSPFSAVSVPVCQVHDASF
jgi:hypothetical protein